MVAKRAVSVHTRSWAGPPSFREAPRPPQAVWTPRCRRQDFRLMMARMRSQLKPQTSHVGRQSAARSGRLSQGSGGIHCSKIRLQLLPSALSTTIIWCGAAQENQVAAAGNDARREEDRRKTRSNNCHKKQLPNTQVAGPRERKGANQEQDQSYFVLLPSSLTLHSHHPFHSTSSSTYHDRHGNASFTLPCHDDHPSCQHIMIYATQHPISVIPHLDRSPSVAHDTTPNIPLARLDFCASLLDHAGCGQQHFNPM